MASVADSPNLALEYGSRLSVRAFALGPLAESTSTAADGEELPALVRLVPLAAMPAWRRSPRRSPCSAARRSTLLTGTP
ncbi:MAG: hypothetical protein ACRDSZ_16150 [Pseudonocardiaceae bacterium]